jgi:hypothetical protein
MTEIELLGSTVSEYGKLVAPTKTTSSSAEILVKRLSTESEWTEEGARVIVSLANNYGAFVLRNALALAVVLDKEDGELGF